MEKTVLIDKSSALNTPINLTSRARERRCGVGHELLNLELASGGVGQPHLVLSTRELYVDTALL
jgi:hypothetical protein